MVDVTILQALVSNITSWIVSTFFPSSVMKLFLPRKCRNMETDCASNETPSLGAECISIGRPGGLEQLRHVSLPPGVATMGYNLRGAFKDAADGGVPPYTPPLQELWDWQAKHNPALAPTPLAPLSKLPKDCVLVSIQAFSVNYADCTIRWGLYASALEKVGYPIVPGFDVAGTVVAVGGDVSSLKVGDAVFGCTLFGSYSTHCVIPALQLRPRPPKLDASQGAAIPAVALTALQALGLAGHGANVPNRSSNQSILLHSAAGGVGSMLVQMAKFMGLQPIVGVVGGAAKVQEAKKLGCHVVIDKSESKDLWNDIANASPKQRYGTIMDPNGASTLLKSYQHLDVGGRLIVFGFHSNLPMGKAALNPLEWAKMAVKVAKVPSFDPMEMCLTNRSVLAFNLSFFSEEMDALTVLFESIVQWLTEDKLHCPTVTELDGLSSIGQAHDYIQSGQSVGKIVIRITEGAEDRKDR